MKTHVLFSVAILSASLFLSSCGNNQKNKCPRHNNCPAKCEQPCPGPETCPQRPACADTCTLACCTATVDSIDYAALLNKEYTVKSIEGNIVESTTEAEQPTMIFNWEEKQVSGTTSCNYYSVKFTVTACGRISFSEANSTRMMCPDMQTEDAFLAAFAKATQVTQTAEGINLTDNNGNTLLSLQVK